ncbi:MAG: CBM20 domain-containing protein, partial [Candidatus Eremiobacteraeota bacterium]|nr:CBM20 domain-containing protein [Candidatus Eremiobacteraeota bacterium]
MMHAWMLGGRRGLIATLACLLVAAAPSQPRAHADDAQGGIFVSYSVEAGSASVIIQQSNRPSVFALAADVAARERSSGGAWQAISLSALTPGEPVLLHFAADGRVHAVDAEYGVITSRLVVFAKGYIITTTGEQYKLVGKAADATTSLALGTYLRLRVDPATGNAFDITTASQPFSDVNQSRNVTLTFVVTVPANTPPTDIIYLATSVANWTANGIRMSPLTGNRWTASITVGSGSSLEYRYTRGSWATDERNAAGVQISNRSL